MDIKKENDELVLRLPLKQKSFDAVNEYTGDVDNLVGVIDGNNYSISQSIDLGYKNDTQEGMPIIMFEDKEELKKVCKEFDIQIDELPICAYCNKGIRGSFTLGDKGDMCYSCELNKIK